MGEDALSPPHVTVTVPSPGSVRAPIVHVQDAVPFAPAVFESRPSAMLLVPLGVR